MDLAEYLTNGGILTSPNNVPARYRAELMRLMATFVDSELAGAAGFSDIINEGPGIKERITAAQIVMEKSLNANRVLSVMEEFGADYSQYASHHPWTWRTDRDAEVSAQRNKHDMRLAIFNYPLIGWSDAVIMNLLMSIVGVVQLNDYVNISYQPLADEFRKIRSIEAKHIDLAKKGIERLIAKSLIDDLQMSIDYWWPRAAISFGSRSNARSKLLTQLGLQHTDGKKMRSQWQELAKLDLEAFGLTVP